jgi:hypothetical protein
MPAAQSSSSGYLAIRPSEARSECSSSKLNRASFVGKPAKQLSLVDCIGAEFERADEAFHPAGRQR